jgi:hypothetical protein
MKRISAIAMSLLLMIGLTVEAQAVTSGVYKCYVPQGSTSDFSTILVPDITHYNPNATGVQNITRTRVFDSMGVLIFDQAFPPGTVAANGRGSTHIGVSTPPFSEGLQIIVNWNQAADALAPIPRLILFLFDASSGIFTSVSQSNC